MHDTLFNPRFTYLSPVHFDELDPMKMLHNSRFAAHVERAVSAWYQENGGKWEIDHTDNPDQVHVVRDLHVEFLNPVLGMGTMRIELWVEHLGTTSCVYGFLCSSEDGAIPYARGERRSAAPGWHTSSAASFRAAASSPPRHSSSTDVRGSCATPWRRP